LTPALLAHTISPKSFWRQRPIYSGRKEEDYTMMKTVCFATAFSALLLGFSAASFAQSPYYVLTNDENSANSASIFNLNPSNGSMALVQTLETGGESLGGGYYAAETQVISPNATCIFVADGGGSADIATFSKATHYSKVGNYTNVALKGGTDMPMIENSQGTLLYAAYESSFNIGVWTINPDCSLTIANIYPAPDFLGSMAITHDGKTLLTTYEIINKIGSWTISGSTLTNNGQVKAIVKDASSIAVTDDDKVVIIGTAYNTKHPSTLITANLPGFTNQQAWTLGTGYSAGSIALTAPAAAGSGCLYIGNTGDGSSGTAGITGATFTENPPNLTYVNSVTSTLPTYVGTINTITSEGNGAGIYAAESAGYIGVYSASPDCSVKLVKESPDPNSTLLLSLSGWVK
jgi:hypothetical protein